ncbi:MAG: PEP-CTERM sorting domain-containing protein [Bryobacteraceae bacterium]
MVQRVTWIAAALMALATAGWGITIPLNTPAYGAYGTGFSAGGTLLTADKAADGNWTFYAGNNLSALSGTPIGAWVFNKANKQPLSNGSWASPGTNPSSQWISPTHSRKKGNLSPVAGTSFIAVMDFMTPGSSQLPSGWSQWWLVMSGVVWADDTVYQNTFYLLNSSNQPVYTGTISGVSPTTSGSFAFQTWVDPGATYKLAFILPNTAYTWAGFRLQLNEAYVTPEPGAWALMLSAGAGLVFASWRRRAKKLKV